MGARHVVLGLALLGFAGFGAANVPQWIGSLLQLSGVPVAASNAVLSEHELEEINGLTAQQQAVRLLERAVNGYKGALKEIEKRADGWLGQIQLDEKLNQLTAVAYCSSNLRVRAAAIEISLAGYGLAKTPASVDEQVRLLRENAPQKFYPLWKLGLLANRGVEVDTAKRTLIDYLKDSEIVNRRWAVNGLGMVGSDDIIEPLIEVFRTDPDPEIRERAACNLAESGMLSREQRRQVIPHLLPMTDDPRLDAQTQGWVYQALREISGEGIASEPSAWRDWWAKGTNR
jgi:HEAT repeat protein